MSTIWIDLDNAPHVPFFKPLIRHFETQGHDVLVTVRDYGFTQNLARQHGIEHTLIGRHSGRSKVKKVFGLLGRVNALASWARGRSIDVAVSHGSRSLVLASRFVGVPCVTLYDYEFVHTSIFNKLSRRVLLPDWLPDDLVGSMGLDANRVRKYPGLKEEVYLGDFEPDATLLGRLGVDPANVVVVLRPPATAAHYHNPMSERILDHLIDRVSESGNVTAIVAPRTKAQGEELARAFKNPARFHVLKEPVDGLNLIAQADLVVGGGGTMNREAAMLGVPVYSVFMGKIGAIDRQLSEQGKLHMLRTVADAEHVVFKKRSRVDASDQQSTRKTRSDALIQFITDEILNVTNDPSQ
jgi:predicted glycosyltransferase